MEQERTDLNGGQPGQDYNQRSSGTPCILNAELEEAELQGAWPHIVGEIGQRLDSTPWWQCKKQSCACRDPWARGLGPVDGGELLQCSPHRTRIRRAPGISVAFRSMVPKTPSELGGCPEAIPGTRGEATLAAGHHLAPTWVKLQRLNWFSSLALFYSCLWDGAVLMKGLGSSKPSTKPSTKPLQKDVWVLLFCIPPAEDGGCASSHLRSGK